MLLLVEKLFDDFFTGFWNLHGGEGDGLYYLSEKYIKKKTYCTDCEKKEQYILHIFTIRLLRYNVCMSSFAEISADIRKAANPEKGVFLQRFFKTGKGQYGEGDVFLGLTVPQSRTIAKQYSDLPLKEVKKLLHSKAHEDRLIALVILTIQYKKGTEEEKQKIYDLYLTNTKYINNWDLVDLSAEYVVGERLYQTNLIIASVAKQSHPKKIAASSIRSPRNDDHGVLEKLAKSESLWERRIAIISTFAWIKNGESAETFRIAELLLNDSEDLIHKAVGWMLREVGKRVSQEEEEAFLKSRYTIMPRTMLRYAIERFPEEKRKRYLLGKI